MTTIWRPEKIDVSSSQRLPAYSQSEILPIAEDRWFWDFAPVVDPTGCKYTMDGAEYWLALSAPKSANASHRHFVASLAVLRFAHERWSYIGDLQLRDTHPGNREWAGMAVIEGAELRVYFTSAGLRETPETGYQQKLWAATGPVSVLLKPGTCKEWRDTGELVSAKPGPYLPADQADGEPGKIHAFRDPFFFTSLANNDRYFVFSASSSQVSSSWNGCVGLATFNSSSECWEHRPPLIVSDGTSTELERAHVIPHDGHYYLFWSTPGYTFNPAVAAPTGLYGAVSDRIDSGYRLLNGSGLVAANPEERPSQDYSWYVSRDLQVQGFVDLPGQQPGMPSGDPDSQRFAGTASPRFFLQLDGDRASVILQQDTD